MAFGRPPVSNAVATISSGLLADAARVAEAAAAKAFTPTLRTTVDFCEPGTANVAAFRSTEDAAAGNSPVNASRTGSVTDARAADESAGSTSAAAVYPLRARTSSPRRVVFTVI